MRGDLDDILTEVRRGARAIYGDSLVRALLYGSHARGEAGPDSDIDIVFVLREPETPEQRERFLDLMVDLNLKYEALLSHACILERDYQTRQGPFLRNVRREGVPL